MIGILGGTGPQGQGLALRLTVAGESVMIGSRTAAKAEAVAAELTSTLEGAGTVTGGANQTVMQDCRTVLVCLPHAGVAATLTPLAETVNGHLIISVVNPLAFGPAGPRLVAVGEGSSAAQIAALLPGARVTTGFNNLSAVNLKRLDHTFDEDVLVSGDDKDAVAETIQLVERIDGIRGIAVGSLDHAATVEAMTAVLIEVNRRYRTTSGVRITGLS
ncbi:NADPH-dependent F420 reductase [Euzebya tangerina]|uniref:NADPH-dependent F420 reductase n=1 Tax=Euzebya tangerina TaxID=591198 RepID=UPI0013C35160|nr:NADPH-dependent F420 reductase [Euzebya tangerina]